MVNKDALLIIGAIVVIAAAGMFGYAKGRSYAYVEYTEQQYHKMGIKANIIKRLTGFEVTPEEAEFFTLAANSQMIDFVIRDTSINVFK